MQLPPKTLDVTRDPERAIEYLIEKCISLFGFMNDLFFRTDLSLSCKPIKSKANHLYIFRMQRDSC